MINMDFQIYGLALIPLLIAVIAMLTTLGLPKRFAPVVSVALGIVVGIIYLSPGDIKQGIMIGLALGLSSVGLYSGTKNTIGK
jgi:mannose/fructose/N-acetylgalactosamine-specific phosphotransferase system component IIC